MKFAAPYQLNCPINYSDIHEFNINFTEYSSFDELKKFVEMYPEHQINIKFTLDGYDVDKIIDFCNNYKNVYIRMQPEELIYLEQYENKNINYIFDKTMPVYSYSFLEWVLMHKTKGIYIADDLTYNLPDVYEQCEERGIKLRVILNKIPTTNFLTLTCPSVQVYRPQDYDFLSKYYYIGEFDCGDKYDWTKAQILYQKWFVDHKWDSDLEIINRDLELPYPTIAIPPELTRLRSVCQHRCTVRAANICSKCRRLLFTGYRNVNNNFTYDDNEHGLSSLEQMVDSIIISKDNNIDK